MIGERPYVAVTPFHKDAIIIHYVRRVDVGRPGQVKAICGCQMPRDGWKYLTCEITVADVEAAGRIMCPKCDRKVQEEGT